jgi:predicted ArsR family transcriptional regulator
VDALEAVGAPELREALLLVRRSPRPVSADDLAAAQGIHRNVARRRLDRLTETGLLLSRSERLTGRSGPGAGRPAKVYVPAPEMRVIEFPSRHLDDLVGALFDVLPLRSRSTRLSDAGIAFAGRLLDAAGLVPAANRRRGLERLCRALGALGFNTRLESLEAEQAVLASPTCPLRPLVVARPEAAELDRAMWRGLVAGAVDGVRAEDITCETCDCLDDHASCRIVLRLPQGGSARSR